jgi:dipeptidyl-peptidase 4
VIRDRKQTPWAIAVFTACLAACGALPADDSLLTVNRLFGTKEFDTESLPARQWSKKTSAYFTLDKPATGTGGELVRHDPVTGKKEVVVSAAAFVPQGAKEPLAVDAYEFSADESKLLLFTNSQRR